MVDKQPQEQEWGQRFANLLHKERERLSEECRKLDIQIAEQRAEVRGLERDLKQRQARSKKIEELLSLQADADSAPGEVGDVAF